MYNYTNYNPQAFSPKKAVKHFTDLEVYQKSHEASVVVVKSIAGAGGQRDMLATDGNVGSGTVSGTVEYILKRMVVCALSIPHLIAEAHSCRFGTSEECLAILDKVMLNCNKMVVYLEQTRDICETGLAVDQFEDLTKRYFFIRQKVLNLQRVWRKYIQTGVQENS